MTAERIGYEIAPLVANEDRMRWLAEYLLELSPAVTLSIVPQLESFERPVLVAWGDADNYMPYHWAEWLEQHVPGVRRVVRITGGKLFFPEESPEELTAALREFWRDEAPAVAA
jgi:pimeloyl-ACP methyl ester carboxylesterase